MFTYIFNYDSFFLEKNNVLIQKFVAMEQNPFTCIFLGISGSGKGTHSKRLIKELGAIYPKNPVKRFESGQQLRKLAEEHTTIGNTVRRILCSGNLVSDEIVNLAIDSFLRSLNDSEFCFLDGYPRTISQAMYLDSSLHKNKRKDPVIVVHLKLNKETALERLIERAKTEGRDDDNPESIDSRFVWYKEHVEPVVKFYKDSKNYIFIEVDVSGTEEETYKTLLDQIYTYCCI